MASGEAEPLQYTTTVLRVSIHCEGCKKKVKKVLHSIEGVYKVTVDAAQHKVTVTGSLGADALIRRLHKAGKQAALWPPAAAPPAAAEAKKPQEVVVEAAPALPVPGESSAKEEPKPPKEAAASPAAKDKAPPPGPEAESKEKKPAKEKKADKAEAAKPNKDVEAVAEAKEEKKGSSPLPAAEAGAEEPSSGKKGGKNNNKKSKAKDGGEGEEAPSPTPAPVVVDDARAGAGPGRRGAPARRRVPVLRGGTASGDELQRGAPELERVVLRAHYGGGAAHASDAAAGACDDAVRVPSAAGLLGHGAGAGAAVRAAGDAVVVPVAAAGVVQQHVQRGERQLVQPHVMRCARPDGGVSPPCWSGLARAVVV